MRADAGGSRLVVIQHDGVNTGRTAWAVTGLESAGQVRASRRSSAL